MSLLLWIVDGDANEMGCLRTSPWPLSNRNQCCFGGILPIIIDKINDLALLSDVVMYRGMGELLSALE